MPVGEPGLSARVFRRFGFRIPKGIIGSRMVRARSSRDAAGRQRRRCTGLLAERRPPGSAGQSEAARHLTTMAALRRPLIRRCRRRWRAGWSGGGGGAGAVAAGAVDNVRAPGPDHWPRERSADGAPGDRASPLENFAAAPAKALERHGLLRAKSAASSEAKGENLPKKMRRPVDSPRQGRLYRRHRRRAAGHRPTTRLRSSHRHLVNYDYRKIPGGVASTPLCIQRVWAFGSCPGLLGFRLRACALALFDKLI